MNHDAQHIYNLRAEILQQENEMHRLTAQRDALLEALKLIVQWDEAGLTLLDHHIERARAAIKKAEENT